MKLPVFCFAVCLLLAGCGGSSSSSGSVSNTVLKSITPSSGPVQFTSIDISGADFPNGTIQVYIGNVEVGDGQPSGPSYEFTTYPGVALNDLDVTTANLINAKVAPGTYPVTVICNGKTLAQPTPPLTFTVTAN